jgi:serine/threonine-protein phosphatase Stp1
VQQLVDKRRLSEREAKSHPQLNVITRAIGATPDLTLERRRGAVKRGDVFLLCSDGLWGALDNGDINEVLNTQPTSSAAAALVDRALQRGARDNVTVVLAGCV